MNQYIVLLRGINVGGKVLKMGPLAALCESMGWKSVRTYLQSGNVLFETDVDTVGKAARELEEGIKNRFGLDVAVLIRTRRELRNIIENNPFLGSGSRDPKNMHVTFLAERPKLKTLKASERAKNDEFILRGAEVFVYCPDGYGRTVYSNDWFEKRLGVAATTRNWNTVNALHELPEERKRDERTSKPA